LTRPTEKRKAPAIAGAFCIYRGLERADFERYVGGFKENLRAAKPYESSSFLRILSGLYKFSENISNHSWYKS